MLPEPGWAVEFNLKGPAGAVFRYRSDGGAGWEHLTSSLNEVGDGRRRPAVEPSRPRATQNRLDSSRTQQLVKTVASEHRIQGGKKCP